MASIPLVALGAQQPPSVLDQYGKIMQLNQLMQQQKLLPGQLQEQQNTIQGQQLANTAATQENQIRQIGLNNQAISSKALADPNFSKHLEELQGSGSTQTSASGTPGTSGPVALHPIAQVLAKDYGLPMLGPGGALEISNTFTKSAQDMATLAKTQGDAGTAALKNHADQLDNFDNIVEPVLAEKDPERQQEGIASVQAQIQAHPELYPPEATQHLGTMGTIQGLQAAANTSKVHQMLVEDATKQAQATKAATEADIVAPLSTPQALADPGAQAAIQAKIADPKTSPADIPRLQALLPKAATAQQNALNIKKREELAQQSVTQGDPASAGQLLASRALTIDELKLRNATPQFMENAVKEAQKIDPNFKAAEASAQGKIAASASNQQFFGNTDSLLTKGGTIDQLAARGQALGNTPIPKYNTLANWTKASLGSGPQAAYAAAALGVADDYSKVMTGGQGSDTSRQQALDIISKSSSPAQLQASIDQIRQQIASQRSGRIGSNPYLRDMYPEPTVSTLAPARQTTSTQQTSPAKFTVGQSVSIKGKSMKITVVHPDGSFDAK